MKFLLTRPSRGATEALTNEAELQMISTHTPLAGRDFILRFKEAKMAISTHTPLAGRDQRVIYVFNNFIYFYSHAPRGARQLDGINITAIKNFYSHAPRGARQSQSRSSTEREHFYSHAPRGARQGESEMINKIIDFYSHAPRGARL